MKKLIFYLTIGVLALNFLPNGEIVKAINNTKEMYSQVKESDIEFPDMNTIDQFAKNFKQLEESVNYYEEELDRLEEQNKGGE
ncbi:hypothetical protein FDB24_16750 [Clostridium botulinum]|uniref:hypothetical protein n=1 Tax=Clostridium botulinum TaxID=1491 RepID=UPI0007747025|nr:hypothetical protein [Clostridium botulinum]NFL88145.1 hypothetical protein [Clostridium botulinum]NFO22862.1 hypothetical protein [Clostridium botulinum]HBJ2623685.1 hypothetical protein [Clostridium botulinum]